ncbi:MAG: hypothetical protein MJK10_08825 [Pseudomonadales bacterium]|nr:hypothetical protein [Pseudomonadales bacterium]NRA16146.1 hypothetical protein [Oceanospirillaceae bacterium]
MPERDDLPVDVPYFGSANQDDTENNIVEKQQELARKQYEGKSGSGWIHSLLTLLLLVAVGAFGYWGYDFKQDQEQRELMAAATEARIADLEQLLADSLAQAKKSGQTLQQRLDEQRKLVSEQKQLMDVQYNEYQKKFAELIKGANAQQQQQLVAFNSEIGKIELKIKHAQEDAQEEMGFMTDQQKTALSGLEERLTEIAGLRTGLTNLEIKQTKADSVQQGVIADIKGLSGEISSSSSSITADLAEMKKDTAALDSSLEQYRSNTHKSLKSLTNKVAVLAKKSAPKLDVAVTARLAKTEQAIKAIDGSRAQVNKEIQRLKGRVNKIQLQLQ